MASRPELIVDNDNPVAVLSLADRRIRDSSSYINKRIANLKAGEAWFDIGRELTELKAFLKKDSKHDTKSEGWYAAFKGGDSRFPFSRRRADQLIGVHAALVGTTVPTKKLPASARALIALSKLPDSHRQKAIEQCSPGSTETDVRRIAKEIGVPAKKKAAKPKAKAKSFDDLYETFRDSLKTLARDRRIQEIRNLCHDLGVDEILESRDD